MKNIHPFPARMAPEIALKHMQSLPNKAVVLDPMTGSGTVLRQAVVNGHTAIGFDMDPLAVLISRAWTQKVCFSTLDELYNWLMIKSQGLPSDKVKLPWMDKRGETKSFVNYWFAPEQKEDLRRLAYVLKNSRKLSNHPKEADLLRVAFSKLIITKQSGASLAWDVSHSRPHKVKETNDFDVWRGYEKAYKQLRNILIDQKVKGRSIIDLGDARNMDSVKANSVDAIITSPPYLNAIDYLRGHRMSLIWFGHTVEQLRSIRSECIGVERRLQDQKLSEKAEFILSKLKEIEALPSRQTGMIKRYAFDAYSLMKEVSRVLKPEGKAIFVVGNSCLKDVFIENSKIFSEAAKLHKLKLTSKTTRDLPSGSRYLPTPKDGNLSKRMKKEVILTFTKPS